jgi:hypothetical protein
MNAPHERPMISRSAVAGAVVFLLMLAPSAWFAFQYRAMPQLGLHHDDSLYWVAAKALASGEGYRIASLPSQPFQTKYPPLFSLMLAGVWKISPEFPRNLTLAAGLMWLLLPVYILMLRAVFRQFGFGDGISWVLCAVVALNAMTIVLGITLMTEIPFSILLLSVMLLVDRDRPLSTGATLAYGLLAGTAYLLRSAALPMLLTVPLGFWLRGRPRLAIPFVIGMLPAVVGWQTWVHFHQSSARDLVTMYYTNYLGYHLQHVRLSDMPILLWTNLDGYFTGIGQLLMFNPGGGYFFKQLERILAIAAILGMIRLARRTRRFQFVLYAGALSLTLLAWHYSPNARFVYAMFPLYVMGIATEIGHIGELVRSSYRDPKRSNRVAAVVIGGAVGCCLLSFCWFTWDGLKTFLPGVMDFRKQTLDRDLATYAWIRGHTKPDETFLAYDDVLLYLYTGRHAVNRPVPPEFLFRENTDRDIESYLLETPQFLRESRIDYVMLTETDYSRDLRENAMKTLKRAVEQSPDLELTYEGPRTGIYKIKR